MKQQKISHVLEQARLGLIEAGKEAYQVDALWLMTEVTGLSRSQLTLEGHKLLNEEALASFKAMMERRLEGEPLQYILGHQSFYGYDFMVNDHVLIPRFETEELVEKAVKWAQAKGANSLIDMCTGSGCIGLSILMECPNMTGTLVDLSEQALEVAGNNCKSLGLDHRAAILKSNLFEDLPVRHVDLIVSNPPYIVTEVIEGLDDEVKGAEPYMALDGGEDGLVFYRKIAKEAKAYLNSDGLLIFEIGYDQMEQVKKIFADEGYSNIEGFQDMSGKDRIVLATR